MSDFAAVLAEAVAPQEEPPEISERLQSFSRYLSLLAEELEARKAHDAPRLKRLAQDRRELESVLEREGAGGEIAALVGDGLRLLEREAERGDASRIRWIELEGGTLRAARQLRLRPRSAGRYDGLRTMDDARLDVRF